MVIRKPRVWKMHTPKMPKIKMGGLRKPGKMATLKFGKIHKSVGGLHKPAGIKQHKIGFIKKTGGSLKRHGMKMHQPKLRKPRW